MNVFLKTALLALLPLGAAAQEAEEQPIITLHSDAYKEIGETNKFSFLIGATEPETFIDIDFGSGKTEIELAVATIADGEWQGTWIPGRADAEGIIKIYGDPTKIDVLVMEGAYITDIDMPDLTNLQILNLEHNAIKQLDLTPFTKLQAIYLNDNPFSAETPLIVGAPKPDLQILEMTIMDHVSPDFNISDYPNLVVFDAYHNFGINKIDPTGCPELRTLCLELTNVETVDVSKNPKLMSFNVAETRVKSIDISKNTQLQYLMAAHASGSINTDVKLENVDLSNNPNLIFLSLSGNNLRDIDLSKNINLNTIGLRGNLLTGIDLSQNVNLYSVDLMFNDMDYATLPLPQNTWGEYFYNQRPLTVNRMQTVGTPIDLSARVLRADTETTAKVWRKPMTGEAVELDNSKYTYADGIITFNSAISDSVYVEFSNDVFADYSLFTSPFRVKTAEEAGEPSLILSLTADYSIKELEIAVGLDGASAENPRKFLLDFGGESAKQEFTVTTQYPDEPNVKASVPENFSGKINIYMPEGDVLTAFAIDGTTLYDIDLTKATELRRLAVRNAGLYTIDLRYNRCLSDLDVSGNQLSTLDLKGIYGDYEKNVLTNLNASNNRLQTLELVSGTSLKKLNLSNNLFTEFPTTSFINLTDLDLSHNMLVGELSLTYQLNSANINVSDNPITSLKLDKFSALEHFDVSMTNLTIETLPLPADIPGEYIYAPLRPLQLQAKAPAVNITAQNRIIDGKATDFVWKSTDGTVLVQGVDIDCVDGGTRFLKDDLGTVYCEMTNPAFPDLTLKTTDVEVVGAPTTVVASFTTPDASAGEMILTASRTTAVYVDWRGDGTEFTEYTVSTDMPSSYAVNSLPGATAKIYTYENPADLTVFSLYGIKLADIDASPMTGLKALAICDAGLTPEQIKMPAAELTELKLTGNKFTAFPYAAKYPDLYSLEIGGNEFTEFDASALSKLGWLVLSSNKLTSVKFNNPNLWSVALDGNLFESIDLNGLPAIEQLILSSNRFETINLDPVKSRLRVLSLVGNRFTFATLPRPSAMPNLSVYYYGNQAPLSVECSDGIVDLSSQAKVGDTETVYTWYLGEATLDPETNTYIGETLAEGDEYSVSNGLTTFYATFPEKIMCVMSNAEFPNLLLTTERLTVDRAGIDETAIETPSAPAAFFDLQGRRVAAPVKGRIYITEGRKILFR